MCDTNMRQLHQMIQNSLQQQKLKRAFTYMLLMSLTPKNHSLSLYDQQFSSYRQLLTKCTIWPQNDLKHYGVKGTLNISCYYHLVSNFTPVCSTASCGRVYSTFWNTYTDLTPNSRHYYKLSLESPFHSDLLYSQQFSRHRPCETSALNNPKMTVNTTWSSVPQIWSTVPNSNWFRSIASHGWATDHFETSAPMTPQNNLINA